MKALTDKMIAGALEFKKNKIWETLRRDNLMALTFSDGSRGYINVFCPRGQGLPWDMGFALYRADELYGFYMMYRMKHRVKESEMQVLRCIMSCLRLEFASKEEVYDLSRKAIREYREKRGIHASGKNSFFDITRYTHQVFPQLLTEAKDRTHVEEALDFLNWLSGHGGGKRLNTFDDQVTCFTAENGTYKVSEVDLPPLGPYVFPKITFRNEVLAHRLKAARKKDILDCHVMTTPSPVRDEEDVICFPWILIAYLENEDYTVRPSISVKWDEKLVEILAENLLQIGSVPREIHVINDRTKNLLEDFCRKTGIRLVMDKGGNAIDDLSDDFYDHLDRNNQVDMGDEEDLPDDEYIRKAPDYHEVIRTLSMMTDDMLLAMPLFMRKNIEMVADLFPEDLRNRLSRLWGENK